MVRFRAIKIESEVAFNSATFIPGPSMISEAWSTSYEQGSLGMGTGSISDRAGRDSWLELRDCPFSRESSSFDMESSPSVRERREES